MSGLVLVFDLDDTLYPERQFALSGFRPRRSAGRRRSSASPAGRRHDAPSRWRAPGRAVPHRAGRQAARAQPEHLAGLLEAYRNHEPELALFDDADWALAHFAAQAKLGLITDGTHHVQAKKVAALGIAPHFQEIVYTHALGGRAFSKPHPRSYEMVEQALAAEGSRLVYVGDNPAKDFVVPNARGWTSVMVERPEARRIHAGAQVAAGGAPQHTIASLTELPAVLGL